MAAILDVKIDGEPIIVFNSVIYIFESSSGYTLELDMIVSEVAVKKYKKEETLIVEIELDEGSVISSIMNVKVLSGRLPQLNVYMDIDDPEEYPYVLRVSENDNSFPNIEDGITIEEIRKIEMPNENVTLKLNLPIDQVEWLKKQKSKHLNKIMKDLIYAYWGKQ